MQFLKSGYNVHVANKIYCILQTIISTHFNSGVETSFKKGHNENQIEFPDFGETGITHFFI